MNTIIQAFDNKPLVSVDGRQFIVNPLTEQIPETTAELLQESCTLIAGKIDIVKTTKIVGEEDKGGILIAGVSILTQLPFGMARWYPNGLAKQITQSFKMEYVSGNLYLNGVLPNDRVTIIDDMVSTGGTMVALIKAVEKTGAKIVNIIVLVEKINYGGKKFIKKMTGRDIETFLQVDVSNEKFSRVIRFNDKLL